MTTWLFDLLAWNPQVQLVALCVSVAGVTLSSWLAHEAWLDYRSVRYNGEIERIVGRSHLRSQVMMLTIQMSFAVVSGLVWRMPDLPRSMMDDPHGPYVVAVIAIRKLLRLLMILLLMVVATRQAADRQRALSLLRLWSPRGPR